jgi:hypothetical protein
MICIPNARMLADHRTVANCDSSSGNDVDSARDHGPFADVYRSFILCLKVQKGVQQRIASNVNHSRAMHFWGAKHYNGRVERRLHAG